MNTDAATALAPTSPDLHRIANALLAAQREVECADLACMEITHAANGDPTTALDRRINEVLHAELLRDGEGWLSEETQDAEHRIACDRVWIVDPIDGTREFVEGIPEWAVSVGLAQQGQIVAGGVLNPSTGELFLGSAETGVQIVQLKDAPATTLIDPSVLVSRREFREGKWSTLERQGLRIKPVGSIAYRLARVASGLDYATCTYEPRHEWDVAGGVALVLAGGGSVQTCQGGAVCFNNRLPKLPSFLAFAKHCPADVLRLLRSKSVE